MKTLTSLIAIMGMLVGTHAFATDSLPQPREVVIGVSDAFIPGGFDSSSDAYVVVNGIFPNGCYTWKRAEVSNVDSYNHEIKSVASVNQGMCLMVLVPFTKEIKLGRLDSGKHTVRFTNGDGTYLEKSLTVE